MSQVKDFQMKATWGRDSYRDHKKCRLKPWVAVRNITTSTPYSLPQMDRSKFFSMEARHRLLGKPCSVQCVGRRMLSLRRVRISAYTEAMPAAGSGKCLSIWNTLFLLDPTRFPDHRAQCKSPPHLGHQNHPPESRRQAHSLFESTLSDHRLYKNCGLEILLRKNETWI